MMKLSGRAALVAGIALMSLPGAAMAQSTSTAPSAAAPAPRAQPAAPAQPSTSQPGTSQPSTSRPNTAAEQRVETRIKQLHGQLHITSAEDSQWNQFAQTMRENARDIDDIAQQRAQQFPTMTAVDNMQSYEKLAEAHVQHLQKLIPAFQALYEAMSPEQKKTADQVFREGAEAHAQARSNQ